MTMDPRKFAHCEHPYPVWHKRKVPFQPAIMVPPGFIERVARIVELDRELGEFILSEPDFLSFVEEAVASNLHVSVHLEGNPLSLDQVRRVTRQSLRGRAPATVDPATKEILNHVAVWLMPGELAIPWDVERICRVHASLFTDADDQARPGLLRTEQRPITSDTGEPLLHPAPPEHIPDELRSLFEWTNLQAAAIAPVVSAAVFFHEFESIHPFGDGNGRTGRTLFHAYLQNNGLPNAYRCRMEAELIRDPELYYKILGWTDFSGNYTELVDYFLDALVISYEDAVARFREKDVGTRLDDVSLRLVRRAKDSGTWFSVLEATRWTGGLTEQTIRNRLNDLVALKLLNSQGKTRAKRYRFADPLADVRDRLRRAASAGPESQTSRSSAARHISERRGEERPAADLAALQSSGSVDHQIGGHE